MPKHNLHTLLLGFLIIILVYAGWLFPVGYFASWKIAGDIQFAILALSIISCALFWYAFIRHSGLSFASKKVIDDTSLVAERGLYSFYFALFLFFINLLSGIIIIVLT